MATKLAKLNTPRPTPIVFVYNQDDVHAPPRRVSLPAQEAVLYCMAADAGDINDLEPFRPSLMYVNGWWICGRYKAQDKT